MFYSGFLLGKKLVGNLWLLNFGCCSGSTSVPSFLTYPAFNVFFCRKIYFFAIVLFSQCFKGMVFCIRLIVVLVNLTSRLCIGFDERQRARLVANSYFTLWLLQISRTKREKRFIMRIWRII